MELLDEVDENNNLTGKTFDKDYMHENKIFHREVCAIIANEKNEILLQKRANCKKQKPNMWGLTAGHVDTKEELKEAMVREISEEIGIKVNKTELKFIMVEKVTEEQNYCFCYNYYLKTDKKISEMIMQEDEVSELKYITIRELEDIINSKANNYTFIEYAGMKEIIEFIRKER